MSAFTKPSKKNPNGVVRHGLYKCAACRKQFTVRMGTIFEESHLPLTKWLQAIHLMCVSKKGIRAHPIHRILECTYEAAWFLCHRIRLAMASGDLTPMGGVGRKTVVTLVERGGKARSFHVDTARWATSCQSCTATSTPTPSKISSRSLSTA